MRTFIARRLLLLIPVLIGVSVFVFALTRVAGNPAAAYITERMGPQQIAAIEEQYHLNDPVYIQYFYWFNGIIHGDWGYSPTSHLPVTDSIVAFFPATFELSLVSIIIAMVVGIALGTVSAVRRNTPVDHATRIMALAGVSLPIFILGLILQNIFAYRLGWFPLVGRSNDLLYLSSDIHHYTGFLLVDTALNLDATRFWDALIHIALPAITLSFGTIAILTRIMRGSMLEVLGQDYVRTARSKGLPERVVIRRHARKNALIPTTTVVGLAFGGLLGGAVLTETIFAWPGLGFWSAQATLHNDSAAIMGFTMLTAVIYVLVNLIVDVMYAYLDPRVRLD
ncbi:MAG TPA: ABC transporter permease [Methanomassiliicoccales archaeon]|nr:ABC transporter permease [Methanomassiliicoccales archaeon]